MAANFTLKQLTDAANAWCEINHVIPANGQAAEEITERSIRYYRTLGLVDGPGAESGFEYGEKHLLQISCLRLLQAQGVALRRIRELLFGRSAEQLAEIQQRGLAEARSKRPSHSLMPDGAELWRMIPLDGDFLLVSRTGRPVSPAQREALLRILESTPST